MIKERGVDDITIIVIVATPTDYCTNVPLCNNKYNYATLENKKSGFCNPW